MSAFFSNLLRTHGFSSSTRSSPPPSKRAGVQKSSSSKGKKDGNVKFKKHAQSTRQDDVKGSKISKVVKAPSSSNKAKQLGKRNWNIFDLLKISGNLQTHENGDCLEGDTLVDDDPPIKCEGGGKSEVTMAVEETLHEPFDTRSDSCLPFEDQAFQPDDERIQDWSDDEVWIFNR